MNRAKDSTPPQQLAQPAAQRHTLRRTILIALALGITGAGLWAWKTRNGNGSTPRWNTVEVSRGDLTVTVSASGNLQPINQVDVGSELSGTLEAILVDDNDPVTKGQELARLDTRKLRDQIVKSRAAVASARAKVQQAVATLGEARANLARLEEVARLSGGKVPSRAELDTARATLARAVADEAVAHASVAEAEATLSTDETNLTKAIIRAPINGVVLARKVEPGQTVVASMNAPVLFTLAEDLTRMELQVQVDEADVGQVKTGQQASFSVDAYPDRKYPASITRVGLGATTTDNVVSYLTILEVSNQDLSLRPGMTATADILTLEKHDVLLIPNAALRFTPPRTAQSSGSVVSSLIPRPPRSPRKQSKTDNNKGSERSVWVLQDGQPQEVPVRIGATNGRVTEVVSGELKAGTPVITEALGRNE